MERVASNADALGPTEVGHGGAAHDVVGRGMGRHRPRLENGPGRADRLPDARGYARRARSARVGDHDVVRAGRRRVREGRRSLVRYRQHERRTQPALYVLWGGLLGLPLLMSLFVAIVWKPSVWIAAVASLPFLVGIMTWLATTKLTLTSDAVRYRSLFSKTDVPL